MQGESAGPIPCQLVTLWGPHHIIQAGCEQSKDPRQQLLAQGWWRTLLATDHWVAKKSAEWLVADSGAKRSARIVDGPQETSTKACDSLNNSFNAAWLSYIVGLGMLSPCCHYPMSSPKKLWPSEPGSAISINSKAETSLMAAMGMADNISSPRKKYWFRTRLKMVR